MILVENSIQMLTSEHNKGMREIDSTFENIQRSIPAHILTMKFREVKKMKNFDDILVEEKMSNLDATMRETRQKADEGEFNWFN